MNQKTNHSIRKFAEGVIAQLIVGGVAWSAVALGANAATAGFVFLVTILAVGISTNLTVSLIASVTATLFYNYSFFPPIGTFTIYEQANWVALISFFSVSVIATRLVLKARTKAGDAEARREEIEGLYALSVDMFTGSAQTRGPGEATRRVLKYAGAAAGGMTLFGSGPYDQRVISWFGAEDEDREHRAAAAGWSKKPVEVWTADGHNIYLPLSLGESLAGVLAVCGTSATLHALESAATLLALAMERERFLAEDAHIQALEEGDALKSSLLRAVSHDLATPLTAIMLQIERLQGTVEGPAASVVDDIAEHTGRLRRRIENLLAMARLEARNVVPRPEPTPAADLFRAVREHLPSIASTRRIEVSVAPDCPELFVDPSLALEILANLLENAYQASAPNAPIELSAFISPVDREMVRLEIADRGSGLTTPEGRAEMIDLSDIPRQGLGLEIARSLGRASGGSVTLMNRSGGGALARIDLPAAYLPALDAADE
ncbi:MAG: DUF4118 domain-containing protein [Acidobacteriota bacterium]